MARRNTISNDIFNEYLNAIDEGLKPQQAPVAPASIGMGSLRQSEGNLPPEPTLGTSMGEFRRADNALPIPVAGLDYENPPPPISTSFIGMEEITMAPSKSQMIGTMTDAGKSFARGAAGVIGGMGGAFRMAGIEEAGKAITDEMERFNKDIPLTSGERLLQSRPFEWSDMITPDFWTDGRAVALASSAAGSSAPFAVGSLLVAALAPASMAGATTATVTAIGRAAMSTPAGRATIGKLMTNPAMQKLAANTFGKMGEFGKAYTAARVVSSIPEALTEGGSSYNDMAKWNEAAAIISNPNLTQQQKAEAKGIIRQLYQQAGGQGEPDFDHLPTIDDAKLRAWKQTAANVPMLAASNALEGATIFNPSKNAIVGTGRKAISNALLQGGEEYLQGGAETGITGFGKQGTPLQGEEFVWSLNPANWTPETKQQVAGGALFGFGMGAAGGPVNTGNKGIVNQAIDKFSQPSQVNSEQSPVQPAAQPNAEQTKLKIGDVVPDYVHGDIIFSGINPDGSAAFIAKDGTKIDMDVPMEFIDPSVFKNQQNTPGTAPIATENNPVPASPGANPLETSNINAFDADNINVKPERHEIDPSAEAAAAAEKAMQGTPTNIPAKEQSTPGNFAVGDKVTSSKGAGSIVKVTKSGVAIRTTEGKTVSITWDNAEKFGLKKEAANNDVPNGQRSSVPEFDEYLKAREKLEAAPEWKNTSLATVEKYLSDNLKHWEKTGQQDLIEHWNKVTEKPQYEVKSDKINVGDTVTRPGKNDGFVVVDDSDPSLFVVKTKQGGTIKTGKKGVVKAGSAADIATVDPNQKQKDAFAVAYRSFEEASKLSEQAKTDSSIENPWPEVIKLLGETIHAQNVGDARIDEQARRMMKEAERASAAFGDEKNEQVEAVKHSVGDKVTVSGEKGEATVTAAQVDNVVVEKDNVGVTGTKTTTIPAKDAVTIDTPESKYRKAIKYDKADSETKAKYDMNYTHIKNILDEKDSYKKYAGLRDSFISNDNKRWMAAYDAITGETIPRKQGERLKYLQDKYPEEHKRLMASKADKRAKSDAEMRRARINGTKVNHDGKIIGRADFIDSAIEGGYRKAVKRPQGAAFVYHLMGDNGKGYVLANKEEFIYASEKIDEINDAAIPDDPEVDALFENPAVTETPTSPVAEETQPEQAEEPAIDKKEEKSDNVVKETNSFDHSTEAELEAKLLAKKKPRKHVDVVNDSDEALAAAVKRLSGELGKLSANPVFNPSLMDAALEVGLIYTQRGVNNFGDWSAKVISAVGEKIKPYLPSTWKMIENFPAGEKYDQETVNLLFQYAGIQYEKGATTQEELTNKIVDKLGEEFKPYVKMAYEGIISWKEATTSEHRSERATDNRLPEAVPPEETEGRRSTGDNKADSDTAGENLGNNNEPASGTAAIPETRPDAEVSARPEHGQRGSAKPNVGKRKTGVRNQNYVITDKDQLGKGGPVQKFNDNIAAIKLIKKLNEENRQATPEEKAVLVRYVGWGGFPQLFDSYLRPDSDWYARSKELKELLSPEEYTAARASTTNAHYTSETVVRAIWDGVKRLGFSGGKVLEPSMGTGNFFGMIPKEFQDSSLTGVELDPLTGAIAKQLYQDASIHVTGFEKAPLPEEYYDLAISNVPFGDYTLHDPKYNKYKLNIHNYFFVKALDKVRPGGLVVFITGSGTMQSDRQKAVRSMIAGRAELLGAIKMPNTAFKENARTEVTTDVLFLRKLMPDETPSGHAWNELSGTGIRSTYTYKEMQVNEYFVKNPDMMLGELYEDKLHQGRLWLKDNGKDLGDMLKKAIVKLPKNIYAQSSVKTPTVMDISKMIDAPGTAREGSVQIQDGKVHIVTSGKMIPKDLDAKRVKAVSAIVSIREQVRELMRAQLDPSTSDDVLTHRRATLKKSYEQYVKEHGYLAASKNKSLFDDDPDSGLVFALEQYPDKKAAPVLSDIFTTRTIQPYRRATEVSTPEEALIASLQETGRVDIERMSALLNKPEESIISDLEGQIFHDPASGKWEQRELYLSGNVRQKLVAAKEAAKTDKKYAINVSELESVQPTDLDPHEIKAKLGSPWIPASDIEKFIDHIVGTNNFVSVKHDDLSNTWLFNESNVRSWQRPDNTRNYQTWGTSRYSAVDLIEAILNSRQINVKDKDSDGKPYVNDKETAAAQDKAENIKKEFNEWVWKDKERSERLAREYNDNFNAVRLPEYNGDHLQIPGLTTRIELRPHQKNAIWRIIQGGNSLIAHGVGLGKTLVMQAAGMKLRQLGLSRKPLYVLPNATISDFETKFREHFPAAKILVLSSKTLPPEVAVMKKEPGPTTKTTKEGVVLDRFDVGKNAGSVNSAIDNAKTAERIQARRAILSRIATEDWDAVLITHNMFTRLPMSPRIMAEHIKQIISDYYAAIESAKAESGNSRWVKGLEKQVKRWEAELEAALSADTKSIVTPFDELGIDYLFVDEADVFKNLGFATKMGRIAGVQNGNAKRSFDMYAKTSYLNKANRGSGVVFATGTPISNTIGEMFTMMRYLIPQRLRELNIGHFDTWAANFGETIASFERDVAGKGYRTVERFAKFVNAPELIRLFREFADVKRAEDVNLPLPTLRTGSWQTVVSPMSEALKKYIDTDITARVNAIRSGAVKPDADNMLVVTSDLRKAALDIRLVLPGVRLDADSKINKAVDNIFRIWSETKEKRSTQIVFCDLSIPKAEKEEVSEELESDEFEVEAVDASVYQTIQRMLVDKGVPKEEIVFIHDAKNNKQKQALFDKMNSGEVRVLIGSTGKAGVGLNVQKKLVAAHHLDVPWRPRDLEQRNGRIVRQGNENKEIDVFAYATEGSADSLMWERVAMKQRFIQHAMSDNLTDREIVEDDLALGFAEISAITSGNPLLAEKVKLENQVTRLRLLREKHESDKLGYRIKLERTLPHDIKKAKEGIAKVEKDIAARKETSGDKFAAEIKGMPLTDRKTAEDVLNSFIEENTYSAKSGEESVAFVSPEIIDKEIGSIGGMMIVTRKTGDDHQAYTITKKSGESLEVQKGQIRLVLKGPSGRTYPVTTPTINGIENRLRRIDDFLKEAQTELSNLESSKAEIQKLIDKPFDRESEYQKLNSRLDDVLKELAETDKPDEAGAKLNSGLDPFQLIPGLRKYSDMTAKEAFNDLVAIGRKVFEETTHGGKWMARMKELLGNVWAKAKSVMGKVWNEVKRTVKSNRGSIRLSAGNKTDSLGFYSAVQRAIEAMDFKTMPAADLASRITKTPGIKQEELDDLGLVDWLKGQDGKVTKEQVLQFVEQGGARLEEVTKGFDARTANDFAEELDFVYLQDSDINVEGVRSNGYGHDLNEWYAESDVKISTKPVYKTDGVTVYIAEIVTDGITEGYEFVVDDPAETSIRASDYSNTLADVLDSTDNTKFSQYQLPGGENYREVLLTLPVTENDFLQWLEKNRDENRPYYGSEEEFITGMRTVFEKNSDYKKRSGGDFRSSHWSEPNVLAHFRLNDRTVDGKKVLFIEEIQSDWHQKGKKEGYKRSKPVDKDAIEYLQLNGKQDRTRDDDKRLDALTDLLLDRYGVDDADDLTRRVKEETSQQQSGIPDAPFKSTPAWSMLAFKRILRMAVEQGYDSVAWTPGEVQAERYDLSKYISDVLYVKNTDGTYDVRAYDDRTGQMVNSKENATIREVEDFIGKDIATKIEKGEGRKDNLGLHLPEETMALSGLDLKVGGEGMKGFYDRILPAEVGKYIKKLDKDAKVGIVNIYGAKKRSGEFDSFYTDEAIAKWDKEESSHSVWSIPITDKMRGEVMSGQTLYSFPANIAHIIPGLSKYNDMTAPEAFRDLVRIGTAAYESGVTNGGKWMQKMREILGNAWSKAKPVMMKVWNEVKKAVSNNRGAIRLGGREIEAKRVYVPAGADKTLANTLESGGWQKRVAADGTTVLTKPEPQEKEIPDSFVPPIPGMDREVAFEFEQSRTKPVLPTGEAVKEKLKAALAYAKRKYVTLPRNERFAPLEFALTQLEHKKGVATDKAVRIIENITKTLNNPRDYQIFSHKVVFDDIAADLEANENYEMPFGLTKENFQANYDAVNAAVTPNVQAAIDARKEAWGEFKKEYVKSMKAIDFDVEKRLTKGDTYFHHIVLDYAELKRRMDPVLGSKLRTPSYRGFLKNREGSTKNILTDYLEPEMEVMGQMMYDVEIAKTIALVQKKYDIQHDLKQIATLTNEQNAIASLIEELGDEEGEKAWRSLSKKQAMAISRLGEMAFNDELPNNGKWDDVIDALVEMHNEKGMQDPDDEAPVRPQMELSKDRFFGYLNYIMKTDDSAAKMTAGLMFKGIAEKAKAIKAQLGKEHVTWRDLIPEGYEAWQPREGNLFFSGYTIPEHIAQALADKAVQEIGVPADKVRRVLLQGGRRREMVVPVEVASTLEDISPAKHLHGTIVSGMRWALGKWKQAVLTMPTRFLTYNFNNLTGDVDAAIAGQGYKFLRKTGTAMKEAYGVFYKGKEMSQDMRDWFERGGFETLLQTQEAGKISHLSLFDRFMEKQDGMHKIKHFPQKVWNSYWHAARKATDFRESILRYAKYLDYLEQMQQNNGTPNEFGASDPKQVMALDDIKDRAFKLSNELLGAYDSISAMGQDIRATWIPFWSWKEVNIRRHTQLVQNATIDNQSAAAVGAAIGGLALRKAPFALIGFGKFAIKATFLMALLQGYNWWVWPEEERDLDENVQQKMHIILGRDADGKVKYVKASGAFADILGWINLDTPYALYDSWLSGRKTIQQIGTDMAKSPVNIVASSITPYAKVPMELAFGRSIYPDLWKSRPIHDKGLYLASSIALGEEYRSVFGLPHRPYDASHMLLVKKSDPLQAAYYSFMGTKQRFMESKGKGEGFFNSPKSQALRYYKESLRYQDEQSAVKYLEQYKLAGGTREGLERSLESMNPTAGLTVAEKKEFLASLNPEQRRKMDMAQQYFDMVIARSGGALSVTKKGVVDVKVKGVDLPSEKKPKKQNFF